LETTPIHAPACFEEKPHISCFGFLSDEEQELVEKSKVSVRYKRGETIIKQGTFANHVMYLDEGLVKVYIEGKPKDLILKIIPSGYMIGLPAIQEGNTTFNFSVTTYTDSTVSLIDISLFKQLLNKNGQFAMKVIHFLNEDTALIYGRFFCLTMKQSHGRVADILMCLANRVFKSPVFHLPISRSDMADLTGLSSESVIRILREFKDQGLIRIEGKIFEILDFDRLTRISRVS